MQSSLGSYSSTHEENESSNKNSGLLSMIILKNLNKTKAVV